MRAFTRAAFASGAIASKAAANPVCNWPSTLALVTAPSVTVTSEAAIPASDSARRRRDVNSPGTSPIAVGAYWSIACSSVWSSTPRRSSRNTGRVFAGARSTTRSMYSIASALVVGVGPVRGTSHSTRRGME
jgi:hypothetical protein